jgi:hypothetical protein
MRRENAQLDTVIEQMQANMVVQRLPTITPPSPTEP